MNSYWLIVEQTGLFDRATGILNIPWLLAVKYHTFYINVLSKIISFPVSIHNLNFHMILLNFKMLNIVQQSIVAGRINEWKEMLSDGYKKPLI